MELLEHASWVTGDGHPRRPSWTVDPRVHALFAARAEAELENRRRIQELIRTPIEDLAR
jgi:hypothetical protein